MQQKSQAAAGMLRSVQDRSISYSAAGLLNLIMGINPSAEEVQITGRQLSFQVQATTL